MDVATPERRVRDVGGAKRSLRETGAGGERPDAENTALTSLGRTANVPSFGRSTDFRASSRDSPQEAPQMCKDMKLKQLASISLFAGTGRRELERIAQLSTGVWLPAGEVLCRQGRRACELIVVREGLATVHIDDREVGVLVPGDFFGELPLLSGQAYTATVTAATPMHVLVLTRAEFSSLLDDAPVVAARILSTLGGRRWTAVEVPEERVGRLSQAVGV